MKRIGILGGMSAASTQIYYARLCALARERLGGLHSPDLVIRSVDFAEVAALQSSGDWEGAGRLLNREARLLAGAGAEILLLATNTMHKVADAIFDRVEARFIHIADATAQAILAAGLKRPGLLATAFTMEQDFYTGRLRGFGLDPLVPEEADRASVHRIIYEELCKEVVRPESRRRYEEIAGRLADRGADCLILGCTEVGMLLCADNAPVPTFDTAMLHCEAAFEAAVEGLDRSGIAKAG